MLKEKEDALTKMASRVVRLIRLKRYSAPSPIIKGEIVLIRKLIVSGEVDPIKDREDIRKYILIQVALQIMGNYMDRAGAFGNSCLHCNFVSGCDEAFPRDPDSEDDGPDVTDTCEKFIKRIEPSRSGDYESLLNDLHRIYGIDKDRDLPVVKGMFEQVKTEYKANLQK
jgi:hypothetical protein